MDEEIRELVKRLVRDVVKEALRDVLRDACSDACPGSDRLRSDLRDDRAGDAIPDAPAGAPPAAPPAALPAAADALARAGPMSYVHVPGFWIGADGSSWGGVTHTSLSWSYVTWEPSDVADVPDAILDLKGVELVYATSQGVALAKASEVPRIKGPILDMVYFREADSARVHQVLSDHPGVASQEVMDALRLRLKRGPWKHLNALLEPSAVSARVSEVQEFVAHLPASEPFLLNCAHAHAGCWVSELVSHGVPIVNGYVHGYKLRYSSVHVDTSARGSACNKYRRLDEVVLDAPGLAVSRTAFDCML